MYNVLYSLNVRCFLCPKRYICSSRGDRWSRIGTGGSNRRIEKRKDLKISLFCLSLDVLQHRRRQFYIYNTLMSVFSYFSFVSKLRRWVRESFYLSSLSLCRNPQILSVLFCHLFARRSEKFAILRETRRSRGSTHTSIHLNNGRAPPPPFALNIHIV